MKAPTTPLQCAKISQIIMGKIMGLPFLLIASYSYEGSLPNSLVNQNPFSSPSKKSCLLNTTIKGNWDKIWL